MHSEFKFMHRNFNISQAKYETRDTY